MWWRYSFFGLLFLVALSGCGFTPIHAKKPSTGESALVPVRVMPVAGRNGQILVSTLEDLLNPQAQRVSPDYILETDITADYVPVIIETDGTVSRYRIDILVPVNLRATVNHASVFSTRVRRSVSYTVSESDYTSYISSSDALERGIQEAANDVAQRVSAYLVKP